MALSGQGPKLINMTSFISAKSREEAWVRVPCARKHSSWLLEPIPASATGFLCALGHLTWPLCVCLPLHMKEVTGEPLNTLL